MKQKKHNNIIYTSAKVASISAVLFFILILWPIQSVISKSENKFDADIVAKSAVVYNVDKDEFVYTKDPDTIRGMASLAKLVTAGVITDIISNWPKSKIVPIVIDKASGEYNAGDRQLLSGESWMPINLMRYMLISSSNIAANNLSSFVTNDQDIFNTLMESYTRKRGFKYFSFANPSGLSIKVNGQIKASALGSAREIAMLYGDILKHNEIIREATSLEKAKFINKSGNVHTIENTNALLGSLPNIIGGKTGFTDLAGGNLVVAVRVKGETYVILVMASTLEDRFSDVVTLNSALIDHIERNSAK